MKITLNGNPLPQVQHFTPVKPEKVVNAHIHKKDPNDLYFIEEIALMKNIEAQQRAIGTIMSHLLRMLVVSQHTGHPIKEADLLDIYHAQFDEKGVVYFDMSKPEDDTHEDPIPQVIKRTTPVNPELFPVNPVAQVS